VRAALRKARIHVDADVTDRKMQKKVREAQLAQYNYILVVGEQEKVRGACRGRTTAGRGNRMHAWLAGQVGGLVGGASTGMVLDGFFCRYA
jgi:threonyl-tRNA synthetase